MDLLIPVQKQKKISGYCRISGKILLSSIHKEDILPLYQLAEDLEKSGLKPILDRNLEGKSLSCNNSVLVCRNSSSAGQAQIGSAACRERR